MKLALSKSLTQDAGTRSGKVRIDSGKEWIVNAGKKLGRMASRIGALLLFSAGEDVVWPARSACVCIEEGALVLIEGRALFHRADVIRSRSWPAEGYPSPELVVSAVSDKEVTLVLPPAWVIAEQAQLPAAVAANLVQAVEFELDRLTPLKPSDALYDFAVTEREDEKIRVNISVCKADTVLPYTKALEERGIRVRRVIPTPPAVDGSKTLGDLSASHTAALIGSLRSEGPDLLSKGRHTRKRVPLALTLLLIIAIAGTTGAAMVLPLSIEEKRASEIERQINALKPEVRRVEQLKKEIAARQKEIATIDGFKERPLTVDLLKELTETLPKDVWLTRVRITDTTIDLEGYAASAAGVLPKLEASPFFRKAEFASPTFRDTRLNADRFVIRGEIENEKVKGETKK